MAYTGSNLPLSGYTCMGCGSIIPFGTTHSCQFPQHFQMPSQDALILTELRMIHELLRKVLLKEKTVALADAAQEGEAKNGGEK